MKKKVVLTVALLVFLALFGARLAWELGRQSRQAQAWQAGPGLMDALPQGSSVSAGLRKNYASEKVQVGPTGSQQVLDQKVERVSDIAASTRRFDADAALVRQAITAAKGVVQRENSWGLEGGRSLSLAIGLVPEAFDPTVAALRRIGKLESATVTTVDRTGDFLALQARRLSLEKTRDALRALRTAGAALADLVALESRILEIEGQIQELGVSLGDFSENHSFCTINITLTEANSGAAHVLGAILDSFGWALLVELGLAVLALAVAATAWLGELVWGRMANRLGKPRE
jgi:hypothetical protein